MAIVSKRGRLLATLILSEVDYLVSCQKLRATALPPPVFASHFKLDSGQVRLAL